jgi:hypothetical protein
MIGGIMALTDAQLTILKADIEADPVLSLIPQTNDGAFEVAAAYNENAVPDFWVWRTIIDPNEIMEDDGFEWDSVDNMQAGRARIWEWMILLGNINASKPNVRSGIQNAFQGNQAMIDAIRLAAQRLARRGEELFATGVGTQANPGTMTFEGSITFRDVLNAWALP